MKRPVIFWDVDTQHDFMDASGKLYVPDAEAIKPHLKRLTDFAHARQIHIVASSDDHVAGHRELSATPDFLETFPEHCMRGTPGAAKIAETALEAPMIIEPDPVPHETLACTAWRSTCATSTRSTDSWNAACRGSTWCSTPRGRSTPSGARRSWRDGSGRMCAW